MKNTSITIVIISSMILFGANVFAFGNESKKACKQAAATKELLKFSVNDFVGTEDSGTDEAQLLESAKTETQEKIVEKDEPSNEPVENNIR